VERWSRLMERIEDIVARETDLAARQRLNTFEAAHRLGVRIG